MIDLCTIIEAKAMTILLVRRGGISLLFRSYGAYAVSFIVLQRCHPYGILHFRERDRVKPNIRRACTAPSFLTPLAPLIRGELSDKSP